jgi:predicted RND superfamily exporter protein
MDHQRRSRYAIAVVLLATLATPLILYGARMALKSTSNDPRQWLPKSFAETDTYDWFQIQFGSDEIVVVSWPGCNLDDPRVDRLAEALEPTEYFDRVRTGRNVVRELMSSPLNLSRASAIRRLRRILIGGEDESTCLILTTSVAGQEDRGAAVREIEAQALSVCQLKASELKLAGPTVDAAKIDAESRKLLFQLAGLSALISFLVASLRMRSVSLAIAVLVVAGYSTALALAIMYFSGGKMNLLMTMLPPLIYVLTISSAVHLANYYRDATDDRSSETPPAIRAISQGWLPCTLAAITTAIGLASLVLSKIEPIQSFGLYSAVGVIASLAVLFLLLPAGLYLFPPKNRAGQKASDTTFSLSPKLSSSSREGIGESPHRRPIVDFIIDHHFIFATVCLLLMAFCAMRLPWIRSTVKLQDRFLPSSDAIADYRWLEKHIGPMVPLEIVVHIDKDDPRQRTEQIRLVAMVQATVLSLPYPVATMSAVNLCPQVPKGHRVRDIVQRKIINGRQTALRLVDAKFLSETEDQYLWRISVRANAIGDLDYGVLSEQIRAAVMPLLQKQNADGTFTGVIPLIYKAQRQLLLDLFRSFVVAFFVIAAVLAVVLRSVTAAALAMIPNVFPAVVIFGSIEWAGIPVQIGSVMTASAALGIAVDDTVHVLTWFRRGLGEGLSRKDAIRDSFGRCAGAMVHTTLICSCGLIVFALSSFVPILHFAWLMVFLLAAALIGDLVLLPAILAGPLGRCFEKSGKKLRDTST